MMGSPVSFNANEIWKTQSPTSLGKQTSHSEQGHVIMYATNQLHPPHPAAPDSTVNIVQMFLLKSLNYSKIYIF